VSPIDFFRRLGISPNIFQNPDACLPRAICFHVTNEMVDATDDPFGGTPRPFDTAASRGAVAFGEFGAKWQDCRG
jgi:hypothetical protein